MSSNPRIAPKTTSEVTSSSSSTMRRSRKMAFHPTLGYAIPPPQPAKVARRNARERNRVKQVNCGFEVLRRHIPSAAAAKKMSKVETLRHAVEYIQSMQRMLGSLDGLNKDTHESKDEEVKVFTFPSPIANQPKTYQNESGYETSSYYSSSR